MEKAWLKAGKGGGRIGKGWERAEEEGEIPRERREMRGGKLGTRRKRTRENQGKPGKMYGMDGAK